MPDGSRSPSGQSRGLAVAIIVVAVFLFTLRFLYSTLVRRGHAAETFTQYKHRMGKALLVALELLVARRCGANGRPGVHAIQRGCARVTGAGTHVRTFLSWTLVVEIEGRWPWQSIRESEKGDKEW
jgi:hypothetical protein